MPPEVGTYREDESFHLDLSPEEFMRQLTAKNEVVGAL